MRTQKEIIAAVKAGEDISLEEAVHLFDPLENGGCYKSYYLLESVVPKRFLDSKEFFMQIIPKRYPFTYSSVIAYASPRLKEDKELFEYATKEHGLSYALSAVKIWSTTEDKKHTYTFPKFMDNKYIAELLSKEIEKAKEEELHYLSGCSDLLSRLKVDKSNIELVRKAITVDPSLIYAREELLDDEKTLLSFLNGVVANQKYNVNGIMKELATKNKKMKRIAKAFESLDELPSDSKLRKAILERKAKKLVKSFGEEVEQQSEDGLEQ